MNTMQSKANELYWATQGVNATTKRKLFLAAFIEIHNVAVEDAAMMSRDILSLSRNLTASELRDQIIRRLRIEVPEGS